jgi:hypothetical protein
MAINPARLTAAPPRDTELRVFELAAGKRRVPDIGVALDDDDGGCPRVVGDDGGMVNIHRPRTRSGRVVFDVTLDSHGVHAGDLADDLFHRHRMALNLFAHTGCSFPHAKARQGTTAQTKLVNW